MVPACDHADVPHRPIRRDQPQLGTELRIGTGTAKLPEVLQKFLPILLLDENEEWLADHGMPRDAEQSHRFQIDGADAALAVEGQVAHRCLFMKLGETLVGNLKRGVGFAEFLVLDLQQIAMLLHLRKQRGRHRGGHFSSARLSFACNGRGIRFSSLARTDAACGFLLGRAFHHRFSS